MPVIFYPPSDKPFKVSFLFNIHFNKHKSLLWHHTANSSHILQNILLKWEVILSGTGIHCSPLSSHICTRHSTQHYWYLNEYFFQPLLPDFKNIHLSLETDSECIPVTSQHHHQVKEQMLRLHWHFPVIRGLWFYWIQLSRELEESTEQFHTRQFTLTVQLMHADRLMI